MRTIAMVVATITSACVSNPAKNVADNGMPARLLIASGTGVRDVEVQTGRRVTSHSDGGESESVSYRTVQQRFKWKDWSFLQGTDRLDEQDWFKLRDPAASDEIAKARSAAWRNQVIGLPMTIVGATGATLVQYGVGGEQLGTARTPIYIGFYALAAAGSALYLKGLRTMRTKKLLPLSRAYEAADEVSHCKGPRRCKKVKGGRGTARGER